MKEVQFLAEALLRSRALSGYQRDFARVVLGEGAYTVEEAKRTLDKALRTALISRPLAGCFPHGKPTGDAENEKHRKRKDVK